MSDNDPASPPLTLILAEDGKAGGIGRYCVDLAELLRAPVACLCDESCPPPRGCWLAAQCRSRGVPLLSVPMPARGWRQGLPGLVRLWRHLGQPLVHANGRRGNFLSIAARISVPRFRYVTTAHGILGLHDPHNAVYRLVDLSACRLADAAIAVSADTAKRLMAAGSPRGRTVTIPNGLAERDLAVLTAVARQRQLADDEHLPLRLGFLGRLSPEKGTREFLEVARRVTASMPTSRFLVAGDGPQREWFLRESLDMRNAGSMVWKRVVEDVAEFLGQLDVLLMPSHNEGMPYALLEAMAAGCVPVAFDVGGIAEVVAGPSLGILVRPGDAEGLVRAVTRLGESRALQRSIGQAASAHIRDGFTLESRLPLLREAYRNAPPHRRPGGGPCRGDRP